MTFPAGAGEAGRAAAPAVASHLGAPVLRIAGLGLRRGPRAVLSDLHLMVRRGEFVTLMGPSGAGKTTVLRAVLGLEPGCEGTIEVAGEGGGAASPPGSRVGMVFQFHHLFSHLTALENVALAPVHARGLRRAEAEARGRELLEELGVGARAGALPRELSGGEAQRVAIARALAMEPPLLLLDEPTASLDQARRGELGQALRRLTDRGRAVLCTTHDGDFALGHATRVAILSEGAIVEDGAPEQVLRRPRHLATRRLLRGSPA